MKTLALARTLARSSAPSISQHLLHHHVSSTFQITIKALCNTRWLSRGQVLSSIIKSINAILDLATELAAKRPGQDDDDDDDDGDDEDADKRLGVKDIVARLTDFKYLASLHFLADLIGLVNVVCEGFQKDQMDSAVVTVKDDIGMLLRHIEKKYMAPKKKWHTQTAAFLKTVTNLKDMTDDEPGKVKIGNKTFPVSLNQRNEFYQFVTEYSTNLHETIGDRFPDFDLLNSFCVLDASQMAEGVDLDEYGIDDITELADHYRGRIDYDKVFNEWLIVKPLMYARRETHTMNQFIAWLNSNSAISVPNMLILFKLAAIIPIGNAVSERGFSAMNNIKGSKSNRMDSGSDECGTLETRMYLKAHMPSSGTPEYTEVVEQATEDFWCGDKKRCSKRAIGGIASGEVRRKKAKVNAAVKKTNKRKWLEGEDNEEVDDGTENATSRCAAPTDAWLARRPPGWAHSRPSLSPSY